MNTIKDYAVQVYWDDRARYFVAEIPEIPTCAADGETQTEAICNLGETFAVLKEAYLEEGLALPEPNPALPVSVAALAAVSPLVKVAKVAEYSGIPVQTLATKLRRGTELSMGEAKKIARTFSDHGVTIRAENQTVATLPQKKPTRNWSVGELKQLKDYSKRSTPTRVIGLKLGKSVGMIREAASKYGIALEPADRSVRSRHSSGKFGKKD